MARSLTDRILAGLCGGLGETLRLNAWLIRILVVIAVLLTTGYAALIYVGLWWVVPQRSPVRATRAPALNLIGVVVVMVLMGALWVSREAAWLRVTAADAGVIPGTSLFLPLTLLILSLLFFLRQIRN